MKRIFISALVLCVIFAASCEKKKKENAEQISESKINVVATIFPLYDFARATAKEQANIAMLTLPGASVHTFEPSPADIKKLQKADVFLYIGGESETWVERILSTLDTSKMKIVRLFDRVKSEIKIEHDEHIWTSPKNASLMLNEIAKAFCEKDLANCESYVKNSDGYISQINELSQELSQVASSAKRKKIVVADRFPFRYLAEEYGLEYAAAFPGCSDQTNASVATMAFLIKTVEKDNIPYIYHVELSNQNVAKAIAEQTGAKMLELHSYHNLSKQEFENGATYLDLFKRNVANLRIGLL